MDERLKDDGHETGLAHIVEAAQTGRCAWYRAGVRSYQTLVPRLCEDGVFALARHARGSNGLEGRVVYEVPAFMTEDISIL
jgi:hypothetical protein